MPLWLTRTLKLVFSISICQGVGAIGAMFTMPAIPQWYAFLHKPSFSPPHWAFALVWPILYTLMGIAVFMVWHKGLAAEGVKKALAVFLFQLGLNSLWPIVFFGGRSIVGGFAVVVALWLAIFWVIKEFYLFSKWAASLLIPYLAWVSFAAVLNGALMMMNEIEV